MNIEILIGIAVFAFVVLVVFVILTLVKFSKTIDKIHVHLDRITTDFAITQIEIIRTLRNCQHLTEQVDEKIKDLDPLFYSINKVGALFKNTTNHSELNHCDIGREEEKELKANVTNYAELANVLIKIFKQFKKWK